MIIQLTLFVLLGAAIYKHSKITEIFKVATVTEVLNEKINNGYQFRDYTYSTMKDILQHPDVVNSHLASTIDCVKDLGIFGTTRHHFQLHPGVSEITQVNNLRNMRL